MCGLAGYVGQVESGGEVLRAMATALAHRGPDGEGFVRLPLADGRGEVGLAHRRLSIIDLADGGQPMSVLDGAIQVAYNGEIYNFKALREELSALGHRFKTHSDSEVLLHAYLAWGERCVARFRGMFAFALWDARTQVLILGRDRFGEKPLYFLESGAGLVFASEISALKAWPGFVARLDATQVPRYLQYRYLPGPATLLKGVRKLQPGCLLRWHAGRWTEARYYTPPDARPPVSRFSDFESAASMLRELLEQVVRLQMQADVPFGAFLSGGLDSSAIVGLMALHSSQPVQTFSVGFEELAFSELGHARRVAQHFGTRHHELVVTSRLMVDSLEDANRFRDAPVAEPADVPILLLARQAASQVKMVLGGEGADEVFAGYPKHRVAALEDRHPGLMAAGRRVARLLSPGSLDWADARIRTAVEASTLDGVQARKARWFGSLAPQAVEMLCGSAPTDLLGDGAFPFDVDARCSSLRSSLHFDQTSWLPDNLLERGDRMTMAAGLEARLPYLDPEVVALASSLPDGWRLDRHGGKRILKAAVRSLLPTDILDRPKAGFTMPTSLWLRTHLHENVRQMLLGADALVGNLFRRAEVRRLVEEHLSGRRDRQKILWTLLNLEIWLRCHDVGL